MNGNTPKGTWVCPTELEGLKAHQIAPCGLPQGRPRERQNGGLVVRQGEGPHSMAQPKTQNPLVGLHSFLGVR